MTVEVYRQQISPAKLSKIAHLLQCNFQLLSVGKREKLIHIQVEKPIRSLRESVSSEESGHFRLGITSRFQSVEFRASNALN
jgi:hypothetical protein